MNADADADADTMIGTIEFLKCAGSPATAEFPLIADDSELDDYVVAQYDNVKFVEDIQQTIVMPSFDGWSECNMVRFESYAITNPWIAYYWITDAVRSSDALNATEFALEFNPITTLMKKGATVEGNWLRSPTNYTPWKQQAVISGTMGYTDRRFEFETMPDDSELKRIHWVSITASSEGSLEIYGFPIYVSTSNPVIPDFDRVWYRLDGELQSFPSLYDLLDGSMLTTIGITADSITDISITRSRPIECSLTYDSSQGVYYFNVTNMNPSKLTTGTTTGKYAVYTLTITHAGWNVPTDTMTIQLSEAEMACGQITIRDTNNSNIATIPTSFADADRKIYLKHVCIIDFAQIYDRVYVTDSTFDADNAYAVYQIPNTHLPYVGSAWDTYKAYSLSYDREAMEFGIDQSNRQMQAALVTQGIGMVASVATGNVAGMVSSGAGMATTYKNAKLSEEAARFNQSLSERRVQAQPGNGYNVNYGLSFLINEITSPICAIISMPIGITDTLFSEFIKDFGYANEGTYTMTITYGFYQGTVYSKPTLTGPRYMELINAFNKGVRLINPSGART